MLNQENEILRLRAQNDSGRRAQNDMRGEAVYLTAPEADVVRISRLLPLRGVSGVTNVGVPQAP
jgi:hypothetical protein